MAARIKIWGEALRNAITNMPTEPVEVISWFISLERLFTQLQVPSELKLILMRPYLNDRAKGLLASCDLSQSQNFDAVKRYLLQEMRLSPSEYLDKFNAASRESAETYNQFATRVMSLLEYYSYIESRKVNSEYDKLVELMVYDKVKGTLPQFLAKHVLADKDGWIGRRALVEAIALDSYRPVANSTHYGRAKIPCVRPAQNATMFSEAGMADGRPQQSQLPPVAIQRVRKCYNFGSPNHIQSNCPRRGINPGNAIRNNG